MNITNIETTTGAVERWDEFVRDSPQGLLFHRYEFLKLIELQTGFDLFALVGRQNGEVVGLFPAFRRSESVVDLLYSPPHGLNVPYLGPIFGDDEEPNDDVRCRNGRFVAACLDWFETNVGPDEWLIKTPFEFADPRAFQRAGFSVVPKFTYTVELSSGAEQLRKSFSKSLRRYLDPAADIACSVPDDEVAATEYVVEQTRRRYAEQGKTYSISRAFVEQLHEGLPDGTVRPYVGFIDGERRSGIVALRDGETSHYWSGGGKTDSKVPLNDLLHWRIIRDGIDEGLRRYDLVGANTPRICKYKSKFNPELAEYYLVTKRTPRTKAYRKLKQTWTKRA